MKNVSNKIGWGVDSNPDHVEPPPIPLVKETSTGKSYGDHVKLKLRKYPTSSTSELYGFRMYLFDHGKPEELLLFVRNSQMTLVATGPLETEAKFQYLCTLVRGEALRQFDILSADAKNTEPPLDLLSFFGSGHRGSKAYSLWDGVVPNPSIGYDYL